MNNLDKIINPIPKDENLKEAIFFISDGILAGLYLYIGDGKPLESSFEELKEEVGKYKIIVKTRDGEYTINLKKYVENRGPGYILKLTLKYPGLSNINIEQNGCTNLSEFIKNNEIYLKELIREANKKYGLTENKMVGFIIRSEP